MLEFVKANLFGRVTKLQKSDYLFSVQIWQWGATAKFICTKTNLSRQKLIPLTTLLNAY